jgi:large subunit ribosomal protein L19
VLLGLGETKDMNNKLLEFNNAQKKVEMPEFRAGDVVKVFRKIIEGGKERIQAFEGMIIAVKAKQSSSSTITVRKVSNGVGVELILPVQSPIIDRIELIKRAKVRRSKLYFVRERSAKSLKMKYSDPSKATKIEKPAKKKVEKAVTSKKEEEVAK